MPTIARPIASNQSRLNHRLACAVLLAHSELMRAEFHRRAKSDGTGSRLFASAGLSIVTIDLPLGEFAAEISEYMEARKARAERQNKQ